MEKIDTTQKALSTTNYQGTQALQANEGTPFMTTDAARSIAEIKGAIMVAQNCPRDEARAFKRIIEACKRPALAEQASYVYNRGGASVDGPSIRLAETAARYWGNLQYGVRELKSSETETMFESFCWDMETNVRASRAFSQRHVRFTKTSGVKALTDPRDQYEVVANSAARRLRACILEIIPGDVIDAAREQCDLTLRGKSDEPVEDRIRKMVVAFGEFNVTEAMIEKRIGHKIGATGLHELVQLGKIYNSLKDGMSKREQWFPLDHTANDALKNELNDLAGAKSTAPLDKNQKTDDTDLEGYPVFNEGDNTV